MEKGQEEPIQEIEIYDYEKKEIPYIVSCESFAELNVNNVDEVSDNLPAIRS